GQAVAEAGPSAPAWGPVVVGPRAGAREPFGHRIRPTCARGERRGALIGHFNADELASFRAGTLRDSKAARISAHLSTCPQCASVHAGLGDVSLLLGSIPAPSMPETM